MKTLLEPFRRLWLALKASLYILWKGPATIFFSENTSLVAVVDKPAKDIKGNPTAFHVREVSGTELVRVAYEGASGGNARKVIEQLQRRGASWQAFRAGQPWDWGPRCSTSSLVTRAPAPR